MTVDPSISALLGHDFGSTKFVDSQVRDQKSVDGMVIQSLQLVTHAGEPVPATWLKPDDQSEPAPAILYCHAHGNRYDIGRTELLEGRPSLIRPYAGDLIRQGYQVLCLDLPCFGERSHLVESATAKACLWQGTTLFGWMLSELLAAIDFLCVQPGVDQNRLATLGISMGGTHAWWLAAIDERISAAVALCCFADLECLIANNQHDGHGNYMTVPGLVTTISTGELAAHTCPRPQFFGLGLQDWSTPENCITPARTLLEAQYAAANAADNLLFHIESDLGHQESTAMRQSVLSFLGRFLPAVHH